MLSRKTVTGLAVLVGLLFFPASVGAQINRNIPVTVGVPATALAIRGCASPSAFVQVFDNASSVGAVVADSRGQFSKTLTYDIDGTGLHTVKLFFDDTSGRTSSVVNATASVNVQATTPLNLLLPSTIEHEPEPVAIGSFLIFRGTTCPNALVSLRLDNNQTLNTQANDGGNWFIIADTEQYYVGSHVYKVTTRLGNQTSLSSHVYQFTTIGTPSPRPVQPSLAAPIILEPLDGYLSSTPLIALRGTGPPNAQLELLIDNQPSGSVFVSANGEWNFNLTMNSALHTITARTCYNGRCGQLSQPVRIRLAGDPNLCRSPLSLQDYRFYNVRPNQGIDLTLVDPPKAEGLLDWGDTVVENLTLVSADQTRLHHIYKGVGLYSGSVSLSQNGCSVIRHFSVQVTQVSPFWGWWLIAPALLLSLVIVHLRHRLLARKQIPHLSSNEGPAPRWHSR